MPGPGAVGTQGAGGAASADASRLLTNDPEDAQALLSSTGANKAAAAKPAGGGGAGCQESCAPPAKV